MKNKNILFSLVVTVLSSIAITLISCNKTNPINEIKTIEANPYGLSMVHTWIRFKRVMDYDKAASIMAPDEQSVFFNYIKGLGLQNASEKIYSKPMLHQRDEGEDDQDLMDLANDTLTNYEQDTTGFDEEIPEFLSNILNRDGVVQVENYLFCLNFETGMVYVLDSLSIIYPSQSMTLLEMQEIFDAEYDNLINGRTDDYITEHSFNEDLIDLYFPDEDIDLDRSSCNESACSGGKNLINQSYLEGNVLVGVKVSYYKYGIFCQALCEIAGHYSAYTGIPSNNGSLLKLDYQIACYKPRCQGAWGPVSGGWIDAIIVSLGTNNHFYHTIYSASRYLRGIKVSARTRMGLYLTSINNNILGTEYWTNWVMINFGTPPC